ncbi:unnamed protein product, partial [Rotaria sp. Silwood2]
TSIPQLFNIPLDRYKHIDFSNRVNNNQNPFVTASRFLDNLKRLSTDITLKAKPDGSQMHPARSCRDIADYYPEKLNDFLGPYFIDPNEGSKTDALLVYCKLTERLTCVNATNGIIQSNQFLTNRIHYGKNIRLMEDFLNESEVL